MKRSALNVTKIAFGLAVAAGFAACKQTPTDTKTTAAAVPVDSKATIVFVNQDTIQLKYKGAMDMKKRMEDKGKSLQTEVKTRQDAFQREYLQAQKDAPTMTQDQQKARGEQLQRDNQTFQQFQQNANNEFQTLSNDESKKLYDKITAFTKTYAKDKGYKMVLTFTNGATQLLYGDPSVDVTPDFLKALNDAYDKDSKK